MAGLLGEVNITACTEITSGTWKLAPVSGPTTGQNCLLFTFTGGVQVGVSEGSSALERGHLVNEDHCGVMERMGGGLGLSPSLGYHSPATVHD